eukprot:COSAG01_NODE_9_length_43729_cov_66.133463_30_plen_304_part_00
MFKLFFALLSCSILAYFFFIRQLSHRKAFQHIYHLAPQSHQKKQTTPSFGGCLFFPLLLLGCLIFKLLTPTILWLMGIIIAYGLLGFSDDYAALNKGTNKGLSAKEKSLMQLILGFIALLVFHFYIAPLSIFLFLFYLFLFVGVSNASNLSDGLDGLLAGASMITLGGFTWIFKSQQQIELCLFCLCLMTILAAFLIFNCYPARIFMGDTGSLALGALFTGLACCANNPWLILGLGGLYLIETLSVIMQVFSFKRFKRRIFLMAPLHHHFEKLGFSEQFVVHLFWSTHLFLCSIYLYGQAMIN